MVFIGAAVVAVAGMTLVDDLQTDSTGEQAERAMQQVDHDLASEKDAVQLLEDGNYEIDGQGSISVTARTKFGTTCSLIDDDSLGTLHYETADGRSVAHQGGGVFTRTESGSTMVSRPDIRYYTDEVDGESVPGIQISITDLTGNPGQGTHSAEYEQNNSIDCPAARYATGVEITVEDTPYHHGWAEFFNAEFGTENVDAKPDQQSVTVNATLGTDQPLESYVGVDPTIYGGLYTDDPLQLDKDLTVDRYNGNDGWHDPDPNNVTEDLLVSADTIGLTDDSLVTGIPVTNGKFTADSDANLSAVGYATKFDVPSFGEDNATGTKLYNVSRPTYPATVYGAKMDGGFDTVSAVDDDIDTAVEQIGKMDRKTGFKTKKTLRVPDGEADAIYYESSAAGQQLDEIDTSGGIIHVAVDSNLKLDDVEVTGNGRAYFYVSGSIIAEDVTIEPNQGASKLWVYGKSDKNVKIRNDFQGVLYAPGSDVSLTTTGSNAHPEVHGAVVGGEITNIEAGTEIHFDETLRTDVPIPNANQGLEIPHPGERKPVDVMFALDRSGSMGPHGYRIRSHEINGADWQSPPFTGSFRVDDSGFGFSGSVQIKNGSDVETVNPGEYAVIEPGERIRAKEKCYGNWCTDAETTLNRYSNPGNDPDGKRIEATKKFVGQMKDGDRAGAIEFNSRASPLTTDLYTHANFDDFNSSLDANANGGTYIGDGVDYALEYYEPSTDSEKIMILLTDGKNDGTDEDGSTTRTIAAEADEDDVTVYTVGLGNENDIDVDLLKDIADITGGNYTHVSSASQLNELFKNIGKDVQDRSIASMDIGSFEESNDWSNEYAIEVRQTTIELDQ
ncbi:flagellin domain-containing protein [Halovivax asiaticus JCM 14624]|uniref:Flagellin domain-containing protein n=1 Tax=Halovivax asiaticus JCM 14624 TaxID=1227490 RepID=M0BCI1_9EURY|nr:flagellin domain-containing protein [Halovivax asiaticus JCM 14624]